MKRFLCRFGWHRWDIWKQYIYRLQKPETPEGYEEVETRQVRTCVVCGYMVDQHVRPGLVPGISLEVRRLRDKEKIPLGLDK